MYELLEEQIDELLKEEDSLAAMCNVFAFIYHNFDVINWVGFYFYKKDELVLGPFQGKVACTRIPIGKGVCGTAYQHNQLLNVADVHDFAGHIACDADSKSELVVPLYSNGKKMGVLDIDSPILSRFDSEDEYFFSNIANKIAKKISA